MVNRLQKNKLYLCVFVIFFVGCHAVIGFLFYCYITSGVITKVKHRIAETVYLISKTLPEFQKNANFNHFNEIISSMSSDSGRISLTNTPRHSNQFILETQEKSPYLLNLSRLSQLLDEIRPFFLKYSVSIFIPSLNKWINISISTRLLIIVIIAIYTLQLILMVLLIRILIASYSLAKPLTQAYHLVKKLNNQPNIPQNLPVSSSGLIIRSSNTLGILLSEIDTLINKHLSSLSAISHDIRTFLTNLRLKIYIYDKSIEENISSDIDQIERLLRDSIYYTKYYISSEKCTQVDVIQALKNCIDSEFLPSKELITLDIKAGTNFYFPLQPFAFKRALVNLISNSLKYGEKCDIKVNQVDNKLIINILDYGTGIPNDEIHLITQPFYRGKQHQNSAYNGSGLGLSIVKNIFDHNHIAYTISNASLPYGLKIQITME